MAKDHSTVDVFISYAQQDATLSADIARVMESYDLSVFTEAKLESGANLENAIWEAISESQALVTVISEFSLTAWMAIEVGAARAWNKPIYAVASNPAAARLPAGLQGITIYPFSRVEEIAQEIKRASTPLSETNQAVLIDEYQRLEIPLDLLSLQPKLLSTLASQFRKRTKKRLSSEELLRTLMRLRKQGTLRSPTPKKRTKSMK